MNSKIPVEVALKKYLETSAQPDDPIQLHRAETLDCLSLSQLDKYLARKDSLKDEQLEHIARCAGFCQKNITYLRRYGNYLLPQLEGKIKELSSDLLKRWESLKDDLKGFGKAIANTSPLVPVFPKEVHSTQTKSLPYPVLIEDRQTRVINGNCRVTRGRIKDGRFIVRLTFEVPQELRRRRPIQLLFVGKDSEVFQELELPGFENQLINVQLPVELPDRELSDTDPLPCALVLRLGQA